MRFFVFLSLFSSALFAHPSGHKVIQGKANITTAQNKCRIQTDNKTIIHWNDFSINKGEVTQFIQDSKHSVVLNRVIGKDISKIFGKLEANGKVYLINPQGILVGDTGVIDTNGFIGSTLDLVDTEFTKGESLVFKGSNNSSIVNLGTITSQDGSIYLLGYEIRNKGNIEAKKNTIGLAAVNEVFLQPESQSKLFIKVDTKSLGTLENSGLIEAFKTELHGLTNPFTLAINNSGKIYASTLENKNGQIFIKAYRGKLGISGQIINETGETTIEAEDLNIGKNAKIIDKHNGKIAFNLSGLHFEHLGLVKTYGGDISIHAEKARFTQGGILDSSGNNGGSISIFSNSINNFGKMVAEGTSKKGGKVSCFVGNNIVENRDAITSVKGKTTGGQILYKTGKILSSGTLDTCGEDGGNITLFADHISLPCAKLYANGLEKGGEICIDTKGAFDKSKPSTNQINKKSFLQTNAHTLMQVEGINKGNIYTFMPQKQHKLTGTLGAPCDLSDQMDLVDPINGSLFGNSVAILDNGNIVVTKPSGETGGSPADVGAFMLYNGTNGELINYATGVNANDKVGLNGIVKLEGNNNFIVISREWMYPPATLKAGAVTFVKGDVGLSGTINTSNSLYGITTNDRVGFNGAIALTNGNCVVLSGEWNSPANTYVGAATWLNGSNGYPSGAVSSGTAVSTANSLYGTSTLDVVGASDSIALTNGNYVIGSPSWENPPNLDVGAATWVNGNTGYSFGAASAGAAVSTANSLYGTSANDNLGNALVALTNGNYVVIASFSNVGGANNRGAAVWVDGNTGYPSGVTSAGAPVATTNSLYGTNASDYVGASVIALTNDNYVVASPLWKGVTGNGGAVVWVDGNTGFPSGSTSAGASVSTLNSLYGTHLGDLVGGLVEYAGDKSALALTNGNYVVLSDRWNGVATLGGAATWMNGASGTDALGRVSAPVSTANSLYGTSANNLVGYSGVALTNNNYVVLSRNWDGVANNAGAATWVDGGTGYPSGATSVGIPVSTTNSLYGTSANNQVGYKAIALTNNNYVVLSKNWDGVTTNGGAATWVDGSTGYPIGAISAGASVTTGNSLYGTTSNDKVGYSAVALVNGNYVIVTPNWDNGAIADVGAATCADGDVGIIGPVTTFNSIVGSTGSAGITPNMFAVAGPTAGSIFAVSFPKDNSGDGRVVIVGIKTPVPPTPPTPPTPTPTPTVKEKEKALYAFYRSIADSEMGQKWNFWPGADFSKPFIVNYPDQTEIRILNQGPFFPRYQERGPFKFEN